MMDRVGGIERVALTQKAHAHVAPVRDAAGIGLDRAGEQREQR